MPRFAEYADMLEHEATEGPNDGPSETLVPDCPCCNESMDEAIDPSEAHDFECLNCRCEFRVEVIGGMPDVTILSNPI